VAARLNASFFTDDFKVSLKKLSASTLLIGGTLAWFFLLWNYLGPIFATFSPNWVEVGQLSFYVSAVVSAVVGIFVAREADPKKFVWLWITLGVLSTIILALSLGSVFSFFSAVLLGVSFGLGFPTSLAFFAENTVAAERARVAGITILVTFILVVMAIMVPSIVSIGLFGTLLLIAAVRSASFLSLFLDKSYFEKEKVKETHHFKPAYRDFAFYLFPWLIFHVAADLALYLIPSTIQFQAAYTFGNALRWPLIAIFGLISGFTADRFGRKQGVVIGIVTLGIGFALLSLMIPLNVIIYFAFSGVAWGSLLAIYLAIPGDLASFGAREQFYLLAVVVPVILLGIFPLIPELGILTKFGSPFSQILSVLLFLSVILIIQAKETLPESETRSRKMKDYLRKVTKLIQDSKKSE